MWNAAKTGAPDVRTEAIDRLSFHAEAWSLIARIPGLVISGRFRPAALRQHRAARAACRRRPGQIGLVRLFPSKRFCRFQCRRRIHNMVQPAVPSWRNQGRLGEPVVDHPAANDTECGIDLAVPGPVIAIAEFVFADELAVQPGPQLRSEGLTVPPSEKAQQESFHWWRPRLNSSISRSHQRSGH